MNLRTPHPIGATLTAAAMAVLAIPSPASAWESLPCGATEATAHLCQPGEVARDGTIPVPLPVPAPSPAPELTPAAEPIATTPGQPVEPTTPVLVPIKPRKVTPPQRPRPRVKVKRKPITCRTRWAEKPDAATRGGTYLGRDGWWYRFGAQGRVCPGAPGFVTGERRAQGPSPASIVSRLLVQVPQLAEDTPYVSSIRQGARGRTADGSVTSIERGRLMPRPIPGHPWSSKSTAPRRGVAASVSWRSGVVMVSVVYSASRGTSTTSVSVR